MMKPLPIDHIVVAVDDLRAAIETYANLGFTIVPKALHPFGTANAIIQLGNAYLELLAIENEDQIPEGSEAHFSFAAFNRDFLVEEEGPSMVALRSENTSADLDRFDDNGLIAYNPTGFERMAPTPDGEEAFVAYSLAITRNPDLPRVGFFTCHHHHPENFWHAAFQEHANGADLLHSAVLVAPDPADHHEFLTYFTGQHDMRANSLGVEFDLGQNELDVITPVAFTAYFGEDAAPKTDRVAAVRILVRDLDATRTFLQEASLRYREFSRALVIPSAHAHGLVLAFVEEGGAP